MERRNIYLTASYLLENNNDLILEMATQDVLTFVKSNAPELTKSIQQIIKLKPNDTNSIFEILKAYVEKSKGTKSSAKDIDSAIAEIQKDKSEITSITNILLRAAMPKDQVEKMTNIQKRRTFEKLAETNGIDPKGKPVSEITSSLSNKLQVKKLNQTTTTSAVSAQPADRENVTPVPTTEPFPGKVDLFKAAYDKTLQLGWPGEPIKLEKNKDGELEATQTPSGKLIPYNVGAKTGVKLHSAIPPTKITNSIVMGWTKLAKQLVYNKFKTNPTGLTKLGEAVDQIIEKNKNYKLSKRIKVRDMFVGMTAAFANRFGGSDTDKKVMEWIVKKAVGMDIFEFQKMIIDEVKSAVDLSDNRIVKMDNVAKGIKALFEKSPKAASFVISPMKTKQDWHSYVIEYTIKSNIKPNTSPKSMTEPFSLYLDVMTGYLKKPNKTWTEVPSQDAIEQERIKIREFITDSKKNPYEYNLGEDGSLTFVEDEKDGDKVIGRQVMYPTFIGKDGLKITVKYTPEEHL